MSQLYDVLGFEYKHSREMRIDLMNYVIEQPSFLEHLDIVWQDVKSQLKDGEAAIEFVNLWGIRLDNFESFNPALGALVITSKSLSPQFVYLTELVKIDSLNVYGDYKERFDDLIYLNDTKRHLYTYIWEPLEPFLKNISTVYYSPTGILHRINFDFIGKEDNDFR